MPTARPGIEGGESKSEGEITLGLVEIESLIRSELGARVKKIKTLELTEAPEGIALNAELDAGVVGGKISITGLIVNKENDIVVRDLNINARGYVKSRIEGGLSSFASAIRRYLQEQYGEPISGIKIVGPNLVVDLEKGSERQEVGEETQRVLPQVPDNDYLVLGVADTASEEDIERAFREQALKFHPDMNRGQEREANEWMVALNRARGLKDSKTRRLYDEKLSEKRRAEEATREGATAEKRNEVVGVYEKTASARPLNPFAAEQDMLVPPLKPWEKTVEGVLDRSAGAYRKMSNFFRPLTLRENPGRTQKTLTQYEEMVARGEAEYLGENSGISYDNYRLLRETHEKTGNFRGYSFRSVGVYDKSGRLTGVRTYKIKRAA